MSPPPLQHPKKPVQAMRQGEHGAGARIAGRTRISASERHSEKEEGGRAGGRGEKEGGRERGLEEDAGDRVAIYIYVYTRIYFSSYQPTVGSRVSGMIVDKIWKWKGVRLAPRSSHSQRQATFPDKSHFALRQAGLNRSPVEVRRETQKKPRTAASRVYLREMQESFKRALRLPLSTGSLPQKGSIHRSQFS